MELIWLEVRSFSALFKSQKWMEGNQPLHKPIIPQDVFDRNIKRSILFSLFDRSSNCVFGDLPTVLRTRSLSWAICLLFTHSICYWERYASLIFTFQEDEGHWGDPFRERFELNQTRYVYKDCYKGVTLEWMSILIRKIQKMTREMIKKAIFACYQYYYRYHHYYYSTNLFTVFWENSSKTKRRYVHAKCQNSVSQELICVLSWNFQGRLKGKIILPKVNMCILLLILLLLLHLLPLLFLLILLARLRALRGTYDNVQVYIW